MLSEQNIQRPLNCRLQRYKPVDMGDFTAIIIIIRAKCVQCTVKTHFIAENLRKKAIAMSETAVQFT